MGLQTDIRTNVYVSRAIKCNDEDFDKAIIQLQFNYPQLNFMYINNHKVYDDYSLNTLKIAISNADIKLHILIRGRSNGNYLSRLEYHDYILTDCSSYIMHHPSSSTKYEFYNLDFDNSVRAEDNTYKYKAFKFGNKVSNTIESFLVNLNEMSLGGLNIANELYNPLDLPPVSELKEKIENFRAHTQWVPSPINLTTWQKFGGTSKEPDETNIKRLSPLLIGLK